jgi:hypothetical protein
VISKNIFSIPYISPFPKFRIALHHCDKLKRITSTGIRENCNAANMVYTIVVHLYAKEDQESIRKLSAKLVEASQVYSQDKETLSWFVMQDTVDPRKFTIVERYLQESVSLALSITKQLVDEARPHFEEFHQDIAVSSSDCLVKLKFMLTNMTVATIPPQQPLLEDFRSLCYAAVGCAYGSEEAGGTGYECACCWCALSPGCD